MNLLSRDAILSANDTPSEIVDVPEWGGQVKVVAMSGTERDKFEASLVGKGNKPNLENFRAKLAAACVVDEEGNRLFSEKDVAALGRKSAAALDRVATAAQRISAMSQEDVDELAGN